MRFPLSQPDLLFHLDMAVRLMRRAGRVPPKETLLDLADGCWRLGRYTRSLHWYTMLEKQAERGSLDQAAFLYRVGLGLVLSGRNGLPPLLHAQRLLVALNLGASPAHDAVLVALGRAYFREKKTGLALGCFAEVSARSGSVPEEAALVYEAAKRQHQEQQ